MRPYSDSSQSGKLANKFRPDQVQGTITVVEPALKLSILDQSPVHGSETPTEALRRTIELAQKAEEWGYHRFWVAEHHGSNHG